MEQNKFQRGFSPLFIILIVVIVVLAAIAAFAIFNGGKFKEQLGTQTPAATVDAQVKSLQTLSGSDQVVDIEKDINSTNVDALDTGLDQVNNDSNSL